MSILCKLGLHINKRFVGTDYSFDGDVLSITEIKKCIFCDKINLVKSNTYFNIIKNGKK